jgi:hypothetical protein
LRRPEHTQPSQKRRIHDRTGDLDYVCAPRVSVHGKEGVSDRRRPCRFGVTFRSCLGWQERKRAMKPDHRQNHHHEPQRKRPCNLVHCDRIGLLSWEYHHSHHRLATWASLRVSDARETAEQGERTYHRLTVLMRQSVWWCRLSV